MQLIFQWMLDVGVKKDRGRFMIFLYIMFEASRRRLLLLLLPRLISD